MSREVIRTEHAPQAIGTVYVSGQIPLNPKSMQLEDASMEAQIRRVFDNLSAVARAAGGTLADVVKLNVFLTDLTYFSVVNEIMAQYFEPPYPARAAIGVASLPKGAEIEMDAVLHIE